MALITKIKKFIFLISKKKYGSIGKKTYIISPIGIVGKKRIFLGNNVVINEFSRIEAISKWNSLNYNSKIIVGDNTSFSQFLHITTASSINIGSNCCFASRCMITTIDHLYDEINVKVTSQNITTNDVIIGNYCYFGMDVKIFPGVVIGDNVIVGANSIVLHDLPSYTVCVGIPAKPIKKYNFDSGKWEKI